MELALPNSYNHEKSELLLQGNWVYTVQGTTLNNIEIKRSFKILDVHFTSHSSKTKVKHQ